jgi:hypothetical protein
LIFDKIHNPESKASNGVLIEMLGLTEAGRKEVYRAVCELVQNGLRKTKPV